MSNTLSPIEQQALNDLQAMLGGAAEEFLPNERIRPATSALTAVRGQLRDAMQASGVGTREIARRLHVTPATVSRQINSDGDMMIGTAALLASALGKTLKTELVSSESESHPATNYYYIVPNTGGAGNVGGSSTGIIRQSLDARK